MFKLSEDLFISTGQTIKIWNWKKNENDNPIKTITNIKLT